MKIFFNVKTPRLSMFRWRMTYFVLSVLFTITQINTSGVLLMYISNNTKNRIFNTIIKLRHWATCWYVNLQRTARTANNLHEARTSHSYGAPEFTRWKCMRTARFLEGVYLLGTISFILHCNVDVSGTVFSNQFL